MPAEVFAILLAAGESSRMGRPKPLLPWGSQTLLEWQIAQLKAGGSEEVIVVLGSRAEELAPIVTGAAARYVFNPDYQLGRASSLRAGAAAIGAEARAIVVLGVDQPRPGWITTRLLQRWRRGGCLVAVPSFDGHRGHPVVVDGSLLRELREAREETMGLRAVVSGHEGEAGVVEIENSCVIVDLNTEQEYEDALRSFSAGEWEPPTEPQLQTS